MKATDALRVLAEITPYQWGLVTSAQANVCGVSRLVLSRLAQSGQLTRVAHGIYKDAGAPSEPFENIRAAWLSTEPETLGSSRLAQGVHGVIVASTSAANLHGIGDLWVDRHEFISRSRRQSQRPEIRYRKRTLEPADITVVEGLPTLTLERTIADLVDDVGDLSLVSDALRDASHKLALDGKRLSSLLAPLAQRHGFNRDDGTAFLNRLLEIAGIDHATIAHRIASDQALASAVTAKHLARLKEQEASRFLKTPGVQKAIDTFTDSLTLRGSRSSAEILSATADLLNSMFNEIRVSADERNDPTGRQASTQHALSRHNSDSLLKPETLAALSRIKTAESDDQR